MAHGHGGARAGAGRKPKHEKYTGQIAALEGRWADRLPRFADNVEQLADGGFEQIEEVYEPAGLIQLSKEVVTGEGTVSVRELAFPHLDPEALVCVKRTRRVAAPDLKANVYAIDRILGKPTAKIEADLDPEGTIEANAAAMQQAAAELAAWRQQMSAQLPNISSAPPTPPISATSI